MSESGNGVFGRASSVSGGKPSLLQVERVKPQMRYVCVCCQRDPVVFGVHWFRKRTVPCAGDGCPACGEAQRREYAYVPVRFRDYRERTGFILELPARAVYELREAGSLLDGGVREDLLGVAFVAYRKHGPKSGVGFADVEYVGGVEDVPTYVVTDALCRMWSVPYAPRDLNDNALVAFWQRDLLFRLRSEEHYRRNGRPG